MCQLTLRRFLKVKGGALKMAKKPEIAFLKLHEYRFEHMKNKQQNIRSSRARSTMRVFGPSVKVLCEDFEVPKKVKCDPKSLKMINYTSESKSLWILLLNYSSRT